MAQAQWQNRLVATRETDPATLTAHPQNWRTHPRRQADALTAVLRDVGWVQQVIVNQRTGRLLDGHLRVALAVQRHEPHIPVGYVDLSADEERLVLATLDPIAALAEPDAAQLAALLRDVQSGDAAIQQLLSELATDAGIVPPDTDPPPRDVAPQLDRAAELRKAWGVEVGQLWQCGEHRVLCGDSTEQEHLERVFVPGTVDALIMDPPYGIQLETDFSTMRHRDEFARKKGVVSGRRYGAVIGDARPYDARPLRQLLRAVREQFWFGAEYYSGTLGDTMHEGAWLVWDKRLEEAADRMYGSCFELVWSQQKHKRDMFRHKWAGIFGTEQEPQRGRVHPTQKPVALLADMVRRYVPEAGGVLDGYLGSGTTLIACEQLQRRCYGIEIDPGYVAVTLQRWADLTGQTPRRVDDGGRATRPRKTPGKPRGWHNSEKS